MYRSNHISVTEVVKEYLARIEQIDRGGYKLNSVLEINPDVLTIAEELERNRNQYSSKLYGIPVLLKDNFNTADRMHTSAGSLALADSIAASDADIVAKLRQKGAIILGKTNMTEFANHMTHGMQAGYSSMGGLVKSPYRNVKDPSGSSTGSAVAVSANLCTAAFGTDTSGSIISPGIKNGIIGFRPSAGSLSQKGIIPVSFTLDTAGPMTRTVMDSAILFSELTECSIPTEGLASELIIGIDQVSLNCISAEESKKVTTLLRTLKKSGVKLKYIKIPPIASTKVSNISYFEFKHIMNQYLNDLPNSYPIRSLQDIIAFNQLHPEATLRFGQTLLEETQKNTRGDLSEVNYHQLMQDRNVTSKEIKNLLQGLDVCIIFQTNLVLQYVGLAGITIPHGLYNDGCPYGIRLISHDNRKLLNAAFILEKIFGYRVPPKLS